MTRLSEIAEQWSGLCRKPPAVRALLPDTGILAESAHEGLPDGGGGGSGSLRRGIGAALSGMRTLNRNRQLFMFTLLVGLVLAGSIIGQAALGYASWAMQPHIGEIEWVLLNFVIEFATIICLVFLLAGLVLSLGSKKEAHASFFEGLTGAKKFTKAIFAWSFVLAFAGMLLFSIYFYSPGWFARNDPLLDVVGILYGPVNVLYEFPFNPALSPSILFNPYREGGLPLTSWIYPTGIQQALTFSAINLLLFILTLFVVPLVVLGKKPLRNAVTGSFGLMKKSWAEIAACVIFLIGIATGVFFTYLLIQAASGMAAPGWVVTIPPENTWIILALVYDGALFFFALVMATVGGIAALELYRNAQIRGNEK